MIGVSRLILFVYLLPTCLVHDTSTLPHSHPGTRSGGIYEQPLYLYLLQFKSLHQVVAQGAGGKKAAHPVNKSWSGD